MKIVYTAEVVSQGGRGGSVESADGKLKLELGTPKELGGGKDGPNPEELFGAAYAACFHSALENAAKKAHLQLVGSTVTAIVSLKEAEDGGYYLGVELRASLPGIHRNDAERILHMAHQTCPYSKATRGSLDVKLTLD